MTISATRTALTVHLRRPHPAQELFITSAAKRKVVRAGRRGGKTTGMAILAVQAFLAGKRVLYGVPTSEQLGRFWFECKRALAEPLDAGVYYKNETEHIIELAGTEQRIRAKTAWNADTLRGDFADLLILDEWQLVNEDAWELVGAPMLLDNNGDAVFVYTPLSLGRRAMSKARDPRHAAKMFQTAQQDTSGRWAAFHFTSAENPHISPEALSEITKDMASLAYRQEIMAEDIDEVPGALWKRETLDRGRVLRAPDTIQRVVVGIDPAVTSTEQSDETGIIVAGVDHNRHGYVMADFSGIYSPAGWADRALKAYKDYEADWIIAEDNNGGEMVESTLRARDPNARIKRVHASRGKAARAEPISAFYEQGTVHHVGSFYELEDQLCSWVPVSASRSPDRLDALVWCMTELLLGGISGKIMPGL